ncbi:MAG: efflux RND transporter permease subunit, partial [Planctomycetota bacterium]
VEREIAQQQEEVLGDLPGLETMTSTSTRGSNAIRLQFRPGVELNNALREVNQRLQEVPGYPPNVLEPEIEDEDPESQDYIAWVVIGTNDEEADVRELFDLIDNRVRPRLERLPGMATVNLLGGVEREAQVRVYPDRLAQRGMTLQELVTAINNANLDASAGALQEGKNDISIRLVGRWSDPEQALETVIRQEEGGPIYLRDVADVVETFSEATGYVRNNGKLVMAMNFQNALGSNVLEVMAGLKSEIQTMNAPGGVLEQIVQANGLKDLKLRQVYDQTGYINDAVSLVRSNIYVGGALAVVVLLLFLRSLRSVGIIGLAIPVSVIGSMVAILLMGRSINVVSLAGLAFSVGMVIDNSIVVLENIYRHRRMSKDRRRAAYDGAKEVAGAVLASTLTTVVVFIPVLMIQEQAGQLFRDIALAICSSVTISYVVAILVIPSAAAIVLGPTTWEVEDICENEKQRQEKERQETIGERIEHAIEAVEEGAENVVKVVEKRSHKKDRLGKFLAALGTVTKLPQGIGWLVEKINSAWISRVGVAASFVVVTLVGIYFLIPPLDYLPRGNRNIAFGLIVPPPGYNLDQLATIGDRIQKNIEPYWPTNEGFEGGAYGETQRDLPDAANLPTITGSDDDGNP